MATLTIARAYQHAYHTYPNYTLAVTGGTLNALGDIVAQISQNIVGTLIFLCHSPASYEPLSSSKIMSPGPVGIPHAHCVSFVLEAA
jgi:hypothetical protein